MAGARRWWIWLAFAVVPAALAIDFALPHDHMGVDFHTYFAAARVGLQQGWSHIYDQGLVAMQQRRLVPWQYPQPFLSPPTVAWIVAALAWLPYPLAYTAWAVFSFAVLAAALAWAALSRGAGRWLAVAGALAPWWVIHAVDVGQVVPLVAAATVVAWRLLRDKHEVAAGLVLTLILLKPNTAALVPIALVFAGRYRAFAAWLGAAGGVFVVMMATLGPHGVSAYASQLTERLPSGADALTLDGSLGVTGFTATALRLVIIAAAMAAAYRLRGPSTLFVPIAIVGSLLISPYLHGSDLSLLAVAGWMVWEERPVPAWRVPLAAAWVLASPILHLAGLTLGMRRWPLLEVLFLAGLLLTAWLPLTGRADSSRRATA